MKHESIRVDKCFIIAREYSTRLAYRQELLSRSDGHTEISTPAEVKNFTGSTSLPCHEHAAFALHSPFSSQIRVGGLRRCVDLAADRVSGDVVMMANTLRRADIKIVKLALILAAAACLLPPAAQAADTLDVVLDQATIMKLPDKVSTIVV